MRTFTCQGGPHDGLTIQRAKPERQISLHTRFDGGGFSKTYDVAIYERRGAFYEFDRVERVKAKRSPRPKSGYFGD